MLRRAGRRPSRSRVALLAQLALRGGASRCRRPSSCRPTSRTTTRSPSPSSITPVLKLGSKTPGEAPVAVAAQDSPSPPRPPPTAALPSPQAEKTPEAIPKTHVPDAGGRPVAGRRRRRPSPTTPTAPTDAERRRDGRRRREGSEQGAANGTETDPLKARAADMYRAQLASWFAAHFQIRGKIPFDTLKTLHAAAVVTVTADRKVGSFTHREAERRSHLRRRGAGDAVAHPVGRRRAARSAADVPRHARTVAARRLPVHRPEALRMNESSPPIFPRSPSRSRARARSSHGPAASAQTARRPRHLEPDESILGHRRGQRVRRAACRRCRRWPSCRSYPRGMADSLVNLVVRARHGAERPVRGARRRRGAAGPLHAHDAARPRAPGAARAPSTSCASSRSPPRTTRRRRSSWARPIVTPRDQPARAAGTRAARRRSPRSARVVPTATTEVRAASHRLVDQLLGALTGRPGGFASEMTYAEKVGRWRRVFAHRRRRLRSAHRSGPTDATALSPAFGPGGQIFYALSTDYSPVPPRLRPERDARAPVRSPARSWGSRSARTARGWRSP